MPGLRATFRLAKVALLSLLEMHACLERRASLTGISGTDAQVVWRRHHVVVRGRTTATEATLAFENRVGVQVAPEFSLCLPRPDRNAGLRLQVETESVHFAAPGRWNCLKAMLIALPKVFGSIAQSASDISTFLRTGDAATAARLRKAFGLVPVADTGCVLPNDLIGACPQPNHTSAEVTVVVPVHDAADDLAALLVRLRLVTVPIVFVNDGSSDPRISPMLSQFAKGQRKVSIITHDTNKGFVAAVNNALGHARGHVILLNTDTLPPHGWVDRLIAPILNDPSIASVTPFSNNAEILSVPRAGVQTVITGPLVDQIDLAAQSIALRYGTVELPTGIGFCMAMNRRFLDQIPYLDQTFGRGYGEEVDWCQKTLALGGRHVALASLFVGHRGGASFQGEKAALIETSSAIIRSRYPRYDQDVQSWMRAAPAQAQILALSIAWLSAISEKNVPIYLAHSMGGGAEAGLTEAIRGHLENGVPGVIVLRVGGPGRWRLELLTPEVTHVGDAMECDIIEALLAPITKRHVIYSCGVGARHPTDAPQMLRRLTTRQTILHVHLHDFFPISPSWNLLDSNGSFEGVPDINTCDCAHGVPALNGCSPVSHSAWRALWSRIFARADTVVAFSETSRDLISKAYPETVNKVKVRPHTLRDLPGDLDPGGRTIGVLGSLNRPKGAEIVQNLACSRDLARRIVVLGEMDGQYSLPEPHLVHGRFARDEITRIARSYDVGLWLIPSICPETFSFATHEALATGLPVVAFDRGAQGEAVGLARNGHVITADPSDTAEIAAQLEAVFASQCR